MLSYHVCGKKQIFYFSLTVGAVVSSADYGAQDCGIDTWSLHKLELIIIFFLLYFFIIFL